MASPASSLSRAAPALQLAVVLGSALLLAGPPAEGAMLLVPTTSGAARALVALAVDRDARLVGSGPLPGSMVVAGERVRLLRPMLRAGVLVFAAPPAGCRRPASAA